MKQLAKIVISAIAVVGMAGSSPTADRAASSAAQRAGGGNLTKIPACSLLTKDEIKKALGQLPRLFDMIPPEETPLSGIGSACTYAGIVIQVDPFPAGFEPVRRQKGIKPVSGIGDEAYFRDNRTSSDQYAELYVRFGQRVLTIQLDVEEPSPTPLDAPPAPLIALAKAAGAKLK